MACPYLAYRRADGERSFDHERPHCPGVGFVSPMKADVCNDRHDFHHSTHCDVFARLEREESPPRAD